jgi:acyl carrier protein
MYETLVSILVDELQVSADAVHPDATCEDAGLGPLAMVELSIVLQELLDIEISDDELMAMKRLADIARVMAERANS